MEPNKLRPWYKQKRYIVTIIAIVGLAALSNTGNNASIGSFQPVPIAPSVGQQQPIPYQATPVVPATQDSPNLSNDNYYTNTYGNEVHSPAYTEDNSVPVGASARCGDGTYSFSQSRRGTCSHHGGVAEWL